MLRKIRTLLIVGVLALGALMVAGLTTARAGVLPYHPGVTYHQPTVRHFRGGYYVRRTYYSRGRPRYYRAGPYYYRSYRRRCHHRRHYRR